MAEWLGAGGWHLSGVQFLSLDALLVINPKKQMRVLGCLSHLLAAHHLAHWLTDALALLLTGSLAHWLSYSLAHWLTGSLTHWLADLLALLLALACDPSSCALE